MTGHAIPGSSDVKEEEEERLKLTFWFLCSQTGRKSMFSLGNFLVVSSHWKLG